MLKSQAPSRRQKVKGQLPLSKRPKTTSSTAAPAGTAGRGRRGVLGAAPPARVSGSSVPLKASIDRRGAGRSPSLLGWEDPRVQIKNVDVAADRKKKGATTKVPAPETNRKRNTAPMNRSRATGPVAAAPSPAATGPVRRVKAKQPPEPDWRVYPSKSTKRPRSGTCNPTSSSPPSSRGRSEARAEAVTAERSPPKRSNSSRGSIGVAQGSIGGGSKSSDAAGGAVGTRIPREKHASATAATATATATATTATTAKKRDEGEGKGQGREEEEEKLPPCPYPGHKNISWTCRGCGGAKHHLTSRSAMEPLQRVHGFKVQRVPNDGDCFFSSIKAALPDGTPAGTGAARAGQGLTVAEMRGWVAEETGEDQLEFYVLQAAAHPEDRWLDFVRPLEDRIPSDDEEEEDDDDDKDDDSYKDDTESAASLSQSQSQSQSRRSPPPKGGARAPSRISPSGRPAKTRARKKEEDAPNADGGSDGGKGKGRKGKRGRGRGGDENAGGASTRMGGEAATAPKHGVDENGDVTVTAVATSPSSDRHARRLRRRNNGGRRPPPPPRAGKSTAAATNASNEEISMPSSPQPATETAKAPAAVVGSPSRKSPRLERGRQKEGEWRVSGGSGGKGEETGGVEDGEEGEKGEADQNEGLPFVETVEDLRRFVRLEGSVVGHGNCMWADTFAHHVVSRRLKITILFVDMEREKSAWPYRVLARTMTDNDDDEGERFVVLKREPSHFVLLKTLPSADEKSGAGAGTSGGGGGGGGGGAVTATKGRDGRREGQACFSRSELPDVVRRLWQIEP